MGSTVYAPFKILILRILADGKTGRWQRLTAVTNAASSCMLLPSKVPVFVEQLSLTIDSEEERASEQLTIQEDSRRAIEQ
jgi:hypothetical protein